MTKEAKKVKQLTFKGTVSRDFLLHIFHESYSPEPLKITFGSFLISSKIFGDIASQGAPQVSMTPVANNGNNIILLTP